MPGLLSALIDWLPITSADIGLHQSVIKLTVGALICSLSSRMVHTFERNPASRVTTTGYWPSHTQYNLCSSAGILEACLGDTTAIITCNIGRSRSMYKQGGWKV